MMWAAVAKVETHTHTERKNSKKGQKWEKNSLIIRVIHLMQGCRVWAYALFLLTEVLFFLVIMSSPVISTK